MPPRHLLVKKKTVLPQHKAGRFNPSLPVEEYFADNIKGAQSEQLPEVPGLEDTLGFILASVWNILRAGIGESHCVPGQEKLF